MSKEKNIKLIFSCSPNINQRNLKLNLFKIPQKTINELNCLLNNESNLQEFFDKLEQFFENWKKIYLKYWKKTEEKEKILLRIIQNIILLSTNLNIRRVHNSTESLNIENRGFKSIKQLRNFFRIRWKNFLKHNTKWFSCHVFNYYMYWLLREITNNDQEITYLFEINKIDNHWKLIIKINKNSYIIESIEPGIIIKKIDKHNNKIKKYIDNPRKYIEEAAKGHLRKSNITYHYWNYKFKIYKLGKEIFFSFNTKPIKKINITGLKRISKYIQMWIKIKRIWKVQNIEELKKRILKKSSKKYHPVITQILDNLNPKSLEKFLN